MTDQQHDDEVLVDPPPDDAELGGARVRVKLLIDWQDHPAGKSVTVDANTAEDLLGAGVATTPKALDQ